MQLSRIPGCRSRCFEIDTSPYFAGVTPDREGRAIPACASSMRRRWSTTEAMISIASASGRLAPATIFPAATATCWSARLSSSGAPVASSRDRPARLFAIRGRTSTNCIPVPAHRQRSCHVVKSARWTVGLKRERLSPRCSSPMWRWQPLHCHTPSLRSTLKAQAQPTRALDPAQTINPCAPGHVTNHIV